MASKSTARGISMTQGSLFRNIFLFSLPLIFSQLLQVMFNMADVAVVGKFSSATALGSVGSTSILVTLFTGFLIGLGCGVNVCVAQHLGACQKQRVRESVHTALVLCTLAGFFIALVCFFGARVFLEMLNTKEDLLPGAVLYLQIYAWGMPALGIFNFGNAVLSANGDTERPLVYLTVAGILNVILNLVFVIGCHMAADGVAQCFKTTILSSKVRLRKPDPDIYHLACRCIGTPEANCAYVGDNPVRDVEGTQAAGFGMMIRIDEPDTLNKEKATGKEFTPDHVITSLSELLDIFPARA